MKKIPYAIVIMDGYGLNGENNGNAIFLDGSKYVGFISRANVFSSYRAKVQEYSSD